MLVFRIILIFFVFLLLSCSKNSEVIIKNNTPLETYFPVTNNRFNIYNCQRINYTINQNPETTFYQLKEVLADTFFDSKKNLAYLLKRFKRHQRNTQNIFSNTDSIWKIDSIWQVKILPKELIIYENNVPFVKLINNFESGAEWNGNAYNTLGVEIYKIENVFKATANIKTLWNESFTIIHKNDSNVISKDARFEVYAKSVGLVYLQKEVYEDACKYNFDGSPCVPGDKIAAGYKYKQDLIEHGVEK
jgi:hypothetical protein